jgi:predicted metal-dependent hydrolase
VVSSHLLHLDDVGPVCIAHSRRAKRLRITVRPSGVRVSVPCKLPIEHGREFALLHQEWIRRHARRLARRVTAQEEAVRTLPAIDEKVARARITQRLKELSTQHGLPYARFSIRRQKTRWGSCSGKGSISLNLALARLPRELMDYVILHELLHTRIRGHGEPFWRALERLNAQARSHRRELRCYSPERCGTYET